MSPFAYRPDAFVLRVSKPGNRTLVKPLETAWGNTDELLCWYAGAFVGQVVSRAPLQIALAPVLDARRPYPWTDAAAFLQALTEMLAESEDWEIRCERDTDQSPLETIDCLDQLNAALTETVERCATGRESLRSFLAQSNSLQS
jgi:hypothetical protein